MLLVLITKSVQVKAVQNWWHADVVKNGHAPARTKNWLVFASRLFAGFKPHIYSQVSCTVSLTKKKYLQEEQLSPRKLSRRYLIYTGEPMSFYAALPPFLRRPQSSLSRSPPLRRTQTGAPLTS
ncbi:hypothetical protein RSOLAG1IB_11731 [Rhizoctonia solani AG-1 IB]|uniref:Uncharacterized protein n=1 Tax=Thanatephorus cucumeris (strain AG1-IB / isolate 7/3/14) TaxID=1108050 RepID=A0A0B7F9A8_THACB|nr:hypothetical protein RSOLAG1IB_11731 [Rhizoctonia solani AG-1 IB]